MSVWYVICDCIYQSEQSQPNLLYRDGSGRTEKSGMLKFSHEISMDLGTGFSVHAPTWCQVSSPAQYLRNKDHIAHFPPNYTLAQRQSCA